MLSDGCIRKLAKLHLPIVNTCTAFARCVDVDTAFDYAVDRKSLRLAFRHFILYFQHPDKTVLLQKLFRRYVDQMPRYLIHEIYIWCMRQRLTDTSEWLVTHYAISINIQNDAVHDHDPSMSEVVRQIVLHRDADQLRHVMAGGMRTSELLRTAATYNMICLTKILVEEFGAWDLEFCARHAPGSVKRYVVMLDPSIAHISGFDPYFAFKSFGLRMQQQVIDVIDVLKRSSKIPIDDDKCLFLAARMGSSALCDHFRGSRDINIPAMIAFMTPTRQMIDWMMDAGADAAEILWTIVRKNASCQGDNMCMHLIERHPDAFQNMDWTDLLCRITPKKVFRRLLEYIVENHRVNGEDALKGALYINRNTTSCLSVIEKFRIQLTDEKCANICIEHATATQVQRIIRKFQMQISYFVSAAIRLNRPKWFKQLMQCDPNCEQLIWDAALQTHDMCPTMTSYLEKLRPPNDMQNALRIATENNNVVLHECLLNLYLRCSNA